MSDSSRNDPAFHAQNLTNGSKYRFFKPIGYNTNHTFMGNFNGQGHTVSGLFGLYYDDPMGNDYLGLFGCIEGPTSGDPITIQNLTVANSFMYYYGGLIGLVTSLSYGNVNYSNINIKDNYISQYNWHTGGIIGFLYAHSQVRLTDIVVDDSNIFEALWGTYDACIGGLIGCSSVTKDNTPEVYMTNCDVYPEMNVYNDCCANYQWFQYRYTGMVIGYLKFGNGATETADSFIRDHVHCTNVLVHYGEWAEQYYCELESAGQGSYNNPDEFKYRRIDRDQVLRDSDGNVIGCDESKTLHDHENHKDTEDNIAVNINFKQLFGGGQGFQAIDSIEYESKKTDCGVSENTHIVTQVQEGSTKRFLVKHGQTVELEDLKKPHHKITWSDGSALYNDSYTVNGDVTLTAVWKQRISLNPGVWDKDGAKYAIYAVAPEDASAMWIRMELNETLGFYEAYVPVTNLAKIVFVRFSPEAFENELSFDTKWDQTNDITDASTHLNYTFIIDHFPYTDLGETTSFGHWVSGYIYLNPNKNWRSDGARFAAYFFNNETGRNEWVNMTYNSISGKYYCIIPDNYVGVIFARMNGANQTNDWNSDNKWNQTGDLNLSDFYNNDYYNITDWGSGEWVS